MSTPEGRAFLAPYRAQRDRLWELFERNGIQFSTMSAMPLSVWFTPAVSVDVPEGLDDAALVAWGRAESEKSYGKVTLTSRRTL